MAQEEKILYDIEVKGDDALLKKMQDLKKENSSLIQENEKYKTSLQSGEKVTKKQTEAYQKNSTQIKKNTTSIKNLTTEYNKSSGTTANLRGKLTELRKELQASALAGDTQSKAYKTMRNEASQLQDTVDRVNAEVKTFADDALVMNTVTDAAQGLTAGFTLMHGVTGMLGVENEKLMETLTKVQSGMAVMNSLQQINNLLQKESRLIILGKVAAAKVATVVQWAWNAAMTANPLGLIIAAIGAVVAGIVWLITNIEDVIGWFQKLGDYIRQFAVFLGLATEEEEKLTQAEKDAAAAKKAHAKEVQNLRAELARMTKENEKRLKQIDREIELLKAQGASQEDINNLQRDKIKINLEQAKTELKLFELQNKQLVQLIQQYDLAGRAVPSSIRKQIEAYEEMKEAVGEVEHEMEVFNAKIRTETEETTKKENEEQSKRLKNAEKALAKLKVLRAEDGKERLEAETELLELEKQQKLDNEKLTEEERLLLKEQYNQKIQKLEDDFKTAKDEKRAEELEALRESLGEENEIALEKLREKWEQKLLTDEEYREMEAEIQAEIDEAEFEKEELEKEKKELAKEEWEEELENRRQAQLDIYEKEKEDLKKKYEAGAMSHKEYTAYIKTLDEESAKARMLANLEFVESTLGALSQLAGANQKYAKWSKNLALAETTISIIKGTAATLDKGMPAAIPGLIMMAAQAAMVINEFKNVNLSGSAPKFKDGGSIVKGRSHAAGGEAIHIGGKKVGEMEGDEYFAIVNKRDSERAAMLDSINQGHGVPIFSNTSGYFAEGGAGALNPRTDFNQMDMTDVIEETVNAVSQIPVVVSEREITGTQRRVSVLEKGGDLN